MKEWHRVLLAESSRCSRGTEGIKNGKRLERVEQKINRRIKFLASTTYELVLLQIINQHLAGLLIAHELSNLIENESAHQYEKAGAERGARVRRLRQALRQVLVEVHRFNKRDKTAVSVLHLTCLYKILIIVCGLLPQ